MNEEKDISHFTHLKEWMRERRETEAELGRSRDKLKQALQGVESRFSDVQHEIKYLRDFIENLGFSLSDFGEEL